MRKSKGKRSPIADLKASGVAAAIASVRGWADAAASVATTLEQAVAERDTRIQELTDEHAEGIAAWKLALDKASADYRADVASERESGRRAIDAERATAKRELAEKTQAIETKSAAQVSALALELKQARAEHASEVKRITADAAHAAEKAGEREKALQSRVALLEDRMKRVAVAVS